MFVDSKTIRRKNTRFGLLVEEKLLRWLLILNKYKDKYIKVALNIQQRFTNSL